MQSRDNHGESLDLRQCPMKTWIYAMVEACSYIFCALYPSNIRESRDNHGESLDVLYLSNTYRQLNHGLITGKKALDRACSDWHAPQAFSVQRSVTPIRPLACFRSGYSRSLALPVSSPPCSPSWQREDPLYG
jgi:hypothetical protein